MVLLHSKRCNAVEHSYCWGKLGIPAVVPAASRASEDRAELTDQFTDVMTKLLQNADATISHVDGLAIEPLMNCVRFSYTETET